MCTRFASKELRKVNDETGHFIVTIFFTKEFPTEVELRQKIYNESSRLVMEIIKSI